MDFLTGLRFRLANGIEARVGRTCTSSSLDTISSRGGTEDLGGLPRREARAHSCGATRVSSHVT
jgi:hypothetical protein